MTTIKYTNRFAKVEKDLMQYIIDGLEKSAEDLKKAAKEEAPVKTGRLRDSIDTRETGQLSREIFTDVPYAFAVEYGGVRNTPRAFFRIAIAKVTKMIRSNFKKLTKHY